MNNVLYNKIINLLKQEAEDTLKNETDNEVKYSKLQEIFNLKKICDHYYELEPTIRRYFINREIQQNYRKER